MSKRPIFLCPHCGAEVPPGALACPQCGSDEETGWADAADEDTADVYTELFTPRGGTAARAPRSAPWTRYIVAGVALLTLAAVVATRVAWGVYLIPLAIVALGAAYYVIEVLPKTERGAERRLYQRLLQRARGDAALVERLVGYERRRNPAASRRRLLQDALDRWERDAR